MQKDFGIHMKGGVITERDPDLSTVRIRAPAGILTIEQMRGIAKIAKKYGRGVVHCTIRQTLEIPHVNPGLLKKIGAALEKNGTPIGSEKDEVVNIISCPGTERCKYANIDTISLTKKIDAKLFGKEMPVKMRIALSGCPNACTSPMLNEIGIIGRIRPIRTPGLCTGCGSCVYYCKEKAIKISEKNSGGPNFKANFANGGEATINPNTPRVPAMKDPKAEIPRAGPALPCRAI